MGTTFYWTEDDVTNGANGLHTDMLNLFQQKVEIEPPKPKTEYIDIPGSSFPLDLSEISGAIRYNQRKIKWTFAVKPGTTYEEAQRSVCDSLNGRQAMIVFDEVPTYYYKGRLTVTSYKRDKALRQICVEAVCDAFKYSKAILTMDFNNLAAASVEKYVQANTSEAIGIIPIKITTWCDVNVTYQNILKSYSETITIDIPTDNEDVDIEVGRFPGLEVYQRNTATQHYASNRAFSKTVKVQKVRSADTGSRIIFYWRKISL